jgi:hypothetical protein
MATRQAWLILNKNRHNPSPLLYVEPTLNYSAGRHYRYSFKATKISPFNANKATELFNSPQERGER